MKAISIMFAIVALAASDTYAVGKITCVTDKIEYYQGDKVLITITNDSKDDIEIPDRKYIDGGFAKIEINNDNTWKAIELFAAANVITPKILKINGYHVYVWETKGYNRNDTLAIPGTYRVIFQNGIISNQFSVKRNSNIQ
jgi:hypothetical protein